MKQVFLFLLFFFSIVRGQDTIRFDSLATNKKVSLMEFITKRRNFLIAPQLDRSPETGFQTGLYYLQLIKNKKDSTARTSNTETFLSITERKQYILEFNESIFLKKEKYILRGGTILSDYNEFFYGVGNDINVNQREFITLNVLNTSQRFIQSLGNKYFAGIQYQFYKTWNIHYAPNGILDNSDVLGKNGSRTSGFGPVFLYDSRDNVIYSSSGFFLDISAIFAQKAFGGQYNYTNFILDARKFIPVYKKNILTFQGLANFNWGNLPFRQLSLMGSDIMMRGYYMGTYRDKIMMCAQTELRMPVWRFIGVVLFAALGEVEKKLSSINLKDIKETYGAGLRFMLIKHEKVNVGGELGFSRNTKALYFGSGEAF